MLQTIYHVIPAFYPLSSTLYTAGALSTSIKRGMLVGLNASGDAVPYDRAVSTQVPVGLAGDTIGTLSAGQFTNRISDMGNQGFASGYITVYSGGHFYIDINAGESDSSFPAGDVVTTGTVAVGDRLGPHSVAGQLVVNSSATAYNATAANQLIAQVVDDLAASSYKLPTGIPSEFEPSGDSDNPRKFCRVKMVI